MNWKKIGSTVTDAIDNIDWKGAAKGVDNFMFREGRGLMHSEIIPKHFTAKGAVAVGGGLLALKGTGELIRGAGATRHGYISYGDGPAKMTNSFTSGAVQAMHEASKGNYEVFSDMARDVVKPSLASGIGGRLDDYGADANMISALYNMGGR